MINCRTVQDLLPLYVGGELSAKKSRLIGLHIEACDCCRTEFEAYCGVRFELQSYRETAVDDELVDFANAVERRVRAEHLPARRRKKRAVAMVDSRAARWSAAAAAVVVVALIGFGPGLGGSPGGGSVDRPDRAGEDPVASTDSPEIMPRRLAPRPYWNAGVICDETARPVRSTSGGSIRRVVGDTVSVPVFAGPGVSFKVVVPQRAPRLPAGVPIPKIRTRPYQGWRPVSTGSVTH